MDGKTSSLSFAVEENDKYLAFASLREAVRLKDVTFYKNTAKWKTAVNMPCWFWVFS